MPEIRITVAGEIHKGLKQEALNRGLTLKALVTRILEEAVKQSESKRE